MKNQIIIHGHFYQPPRENPWTGVIPFQESAAPHHDWNKRITNECYAANSASRRLFADGSIRDILNNYEYISFNFGPTLFSWLEIEAPSVYQRILDADKISMTRNNGHGNAIAQVYNHIILPLASPRDRKTQVGWGLEDFKTRFRRDAEGIWLSETAVNNDVLDLLIAEGLTFVILSPWQAQRFRKADSNEWIDLGDKPIDPRRAYRIERKNGSIAVFFYNHNLAHGISFDHYLRNAETLYGRIMTHHSDEEGTSLISIATDGEIYGHHEPFGDMCLAELIRKVEGSEELEWSNFGAFLETYPPRHIVELREGEGNRGTSWSCVHGVSRWYKDCGCTTGGNLKWNQGWRTPLKNAFDNLNEGLWKIFTREAKKITNHHPEELRNSYIAVMAGNESIKEFAKRVVKPGVNPDEIAGKLGRLLEGQRNSMYMFTSCGWFFSELSGIEPVQNMTYALESVRLYGPFSTEEMLTAFQKDLEKTVSNIPDKGTGADILARDIMPREKGIKFPAIVFILNDLIHRKNKHRNNRGTSRFGFYDLGEISSDRKQHSAEGQITLSHRYTLRKAAYSYRLNWMEDLHLTLWHEGKEVSVDTGDLPADLRTNLVHHLFRSLEDRALKSVEVLKTEIEQIFKSYQNFGITTPPFLKRVAAVCLEGILSRLFDQPDFLLDEKGFNLLREVMQKASDWGISLSGRGIYESASHLLAHMTDQLNDSFDQELTERILSFCKILRTGGLEPDLTYPQNRLFELKQRWIETNRENAEKGVFESRNGLRNLILLGNHLGINMEDIKEFQVSCT